MKKNKKAKEIKKDFLLYVYAVCDCNFDSNNNPIITPNCKYYTLTYTKEDCEEYIDCKLYDDNEEHYQQWCNLRNLNSYEENSWNEYYNTVLYDKNPYAIIKMQIMFSDLLAMVRLFEGCHPIGCSFDKKLELMYYNEDIINLINDNYNNEEENIDKILNSKNIVQ